MFETEAAIFNFLKKIFVFVFSCDLHWTSQNNYFMQHLWMAALAFLSPKNFPSLMLLALQEALWATSIEGIPPHSEWCAVMSGKTMIQFNFFKCFSNIVLCNFISSLFTVDLFKQNWTLFSFMWDVLKTVFFSVNMRENVAVSIED